MYGSKSNIRASERIQQRGSIRSVINKWRQWHKVLDEWITVPRNQAGVEIGDILIYNNQPVSGRYRETTTLRLVRHGHQLLTFLLKFERRMS